MKSRLGPRRAELEARLVMLRSHRTRLLAELGAREAAGGHGAAAEIRTHRLPKIRSRIARIETALRAGRSQ
jgi:hypothetical protein